MNKTTLFLLILIFALCVTSLHAFGKKEKAATVNTAAQEENFRISLPEPAQPLPLNQSMQVQVTGTVRLVGTGLFNDIVITGAENEWYAAAEEKEKLINLQHRTVTVEGEETVTELAFASGIPAGKRRELKNISIISIE